LHDCSSFIFKPNDFAKGFKDARNFYLRTQYDRNGILINHPDNSGFDFRFWNGMDRMIKPDKWENLYKYMYIYLIRPDILYNDRHILRDKTMTKKKYLSTGESKRLLRQGDELIKILNGQIALLRKKNNSYYISTVKQTVNNIKEVQSNILKDTRDGRTVTGKKIEQTLALIVLFALIKESKKNVDAVKKFFSDSGEIKTYLLEKKIKDTSYLQNIKTFKKDADIKPWHLRLQEKCWRTLLEVPRKNRKMTPQLIDKKKLWSKIIESHSLDAILKMTISYGDEWKSFDEFLERFKLEEGINKK